MLSSNFVYLSCAERLNCKASTNLKWCSCFICWSYDRLHGDSLVLINHRLRVVWSSKDWILASRAVGLQSKVVNGRQTTSTSNFLHNQWKINPANIYVLACETSKVYMNISFKFTFHLKRVWRHFEDAENFFFLAKLQGPYLLSG